MFIVTTTYEHFQGRYQGSKVSFWGSSLVALQCFLAVFLVVLL